MQSMKKFPVISVVVLSLIIGACALADLLAPYDPAQFDSEAINQPPGADHILGTDTMGRDLLSMLLYGGRISIYIGLLSGFVSTGIAIVFGTVSGFLREWISDLLMGFCELLMSIPSLLLVIFLQGIWGKPTATSLALIIGATGWMNLSKIVRSEVRQIKGSDYVLAAKTMEGGFWYIMLRHLLPNLISSTMFMVVTNIGQAMITESTLSFLGLGLPLSEISWGSLLSMSREVLLTGSWWMILIPGGALIITLVFMTGVGEFIRKGNNRVYSNL